MDIKDYSLVKQELLDCLIGQRPTAEISRRLGYSFDQVRRWRSGSKDLRWDEFCDLCEVLQVPLRQTMITTFEMMFRDSDDLYFFVGQFRKEHIPHSRGDLQAAFKIHPSILKRYFNGQVFPKLEFVFQLMNLRENYLSRFLVNLVGPQNLNHFHEAFREPLTQVRAVTQIPLAAAVEGLLSIAEYKKLAVHDESWFCHKLGITPTQFLRVWNHLVQSGQVTKVGEKYAATYTSINTNGASTHEICKMVDFWTERARQRFLGRDHKPVNRNGNPNTVMYRIVPMSKDTMTKATEILLRAYRDIVDVAEADESGLHTDVRVLLIHHFSVMDMPENPLSTLQEPDLDKKDPQGSNLSIKV